MLSVLVGIKAKMEDPRPHDDHPRSQRVHDDEPSSKRGKLTNNNNRDVNDYVNFSGLLCSSGSSVARHADSSPVVNILKVAAVVAAINSNC